ncbi:hypothetical protein Y032_0043g720 [Ancylostoma ceylanicum]|uniref:Uncharacterized protein n=1 Tax=Ancylostoma ceylanicum TaxID=53326 RepID=A0A016UFS3_9BILA|nr:hypothetical protein Y032_0043g720 [Ancylostoma ceylanicum]
MALHFHKRQIVLSASTLKTLVSRYRDYSKEIEYATIDEENYQKCRSTVALLRSSIRQIKEARENLQGLYDDIREEYRNCKNKSEKKDIMVEIEQIEEESQLLTAIAEANDLIFMITARLDESKNICENMEIKLGYLTIRTQRDDNPNRDDLETRDHNDEEVEQTSIQSDPNGTQNVRSGTSNNVVSSVHRSVKPPQASLPKFYGNPEDFSEYWAIFEALVHNSKELDVIEKILLLKESLKGRA